MRRVGAHRKQSCRAPSTGFTLVELVMVVALTGVVVVMVGAVLSRPLEGFVAQSRRAELVDLAAGALNRMARDIRLALPNSLRAPDNLTLELLPIHEGGRYRANLGTGAVRHDPPRCPAAAAPCSIEVLSPGLSAARVTQARWMAIYTIGSSRQGDGVWPPANANAVAVPSVITPTGVGFGLSGNQLTLGAAAAGFAFKYASPQHRFYLVREVVGYRCDNPGTDANGDGLGVIRRASFDTLAAGYSYSAANSAVLVDSVASCTFSYAPGTSTRGGLVTLRLGLKKRNEEIVLLQQVHVDNAP